MKNVGVQHVLAALDGVRNPCQAPHTEQRIDVADDVARKPGGVRPGDKDRAEGECDTGDEALERV